jgi:D-sedoheptulose 7-phosphate isomerase
MKETTKQIYEELLERYPALDVCCEQILSAFEVLRSAYENGGTVFCGGNGGSASDCEHVVGELLKSFKRHRAIDEKTASALLAFGEDGAYLCDKLEGSLPTVSLISQTGVMTAFANDKAWDTAMAQQLYGLGRAGDVVWVFSTSGNSRNCVLSVLVAKAKGLKTIGFAGKNGGKLKSLCDVCVCVPETETYKVQELHLPVYHALCAMLEAEFFA